MSDTQTDLLTADNCAVLFIDLQPQMAFGTINIDTQTLKNNVVALAKSAKVFGVPAFVTSVETESFSGFVWPELLDVYPGQDILERSSMNSWDDQKVRDAIGGTGRKKLILSGLWTEVCINLCAFSALADGYEVYVVADACGGTSPVAHEVSMQRMIQAGVRPLTWQQTLLEWQRDWANKETYDPVLDVVREHSGVYGMDVDYAYTMDHQADQRAQNSGKVIK